MNALQTILNENKMSVSKTMESIHQPCSDLLVRCRFEYQIRPCMELFEDSLSHMGMCCTFNGRNNFLFEWFFIDGRWPFWKCNRISDTQNTMAFRLDYPLWWNRPTISIIRRAIRAIWNCWSTKALSFRAIWVRWRCCLIEVKIFCEFTRTLRNVHRM